VPDANGQAQNEMSPGMRRSEKGIRVPSDSGDKGISSICLLKIFVGSLFTAK